MLRFLFWWALAWTLVTLVVLGVGLFVFHPIIWATIGLGIGSAIAWGLLVFVRRVDAKQK